MRVLHLCFIYVALFAASATLSVSCIEVSYSAVAFRCDPKQKSPCPEDDTHSWVCCSDDASAGGGRLPKFGDEPDEDSTKWGIPLFAGQHNQLSRSGMCVNVGSGAGQVNGPIESGQAQGCLLPCNPSWDKDDVEDVCGSDRICCQTAEITENDCNF